MVMNCRFVVWASDKKKQYISTRGFFSGETIQICKMDFILQNQDLIFGLLKIMEGPNFSQIFLNSLNTLSWFLYVETGGVFWKQ